MGWTSYMATHYKNGKVDVKAEMDNIYTWGDKHGSAKVLKSSMVGSIYYGAIEVLRQSERKVVAAIAITSVSTSDGMNFGYKGMDESMIPCYYDCPLTILKLLTPTESENSMEWRRRCLEKRKQPKLADIKVGQEIVWHMATGDVVLIKRAPNYQFKRTWWYCPSTNCYVPSKHINKWNLKED